MHIRWALLLGAVVLLQPDAWADVSLPDVISSGMVLQRDRVVKVWGTAEPGEEVTVRFGGQSRTAETGANGKWQVALQPMAASSTPATMTISGKNTVTVDNVLVGEVWVVSGQSNMQFAVIQAADGAAAIAAARAPDIRLFNLSRSVAFQHARGKLATWQPVSPASVRSFSAAGYFFALELRNALHVPIGVVNSSYGGTQAESWTPIEYLLASPDLRPCVERSKAWDAERPAVQAKYQQRMSEWAAAAQKAKSQGTSPPRKPPVPDALREDRPAGALYDRMIAPLIPFSMRGVVWYQGESNEARAQQYELLLPTMIKAWRDRWGQGDFPFGVVQLPNYRDMREEPVDEAWSFLREAQRRTAVAVPHSGLIVTIDIGEAHDIHPKNKREVGKRMARWALVAAYHQKITPTGPMFRKAKRRGSKLELKFDVVGKGLRIRDGDKLDEFAVAGPEHQWHWANAQLKGRDRVIVWCAEVPRPEAVRYAFNSNPRHPNLTNDTGIPASPFRSDNWPGPTDGKR